MLLLNIASSPYNVEVSEQLAFRETNKFAELVSWKEDRELK